MSERRDQFLMAMYGEMWENINRHILVVWQSVGVLAGAFAALIVAEQTAVPLDVSASIVALVGCWQMAHVLDASWWFNRNQLILANIERQFLQHSDVREVHSYFLKHRNPSMLDYLRIQFVFGGLATGAVLVYHFIERVAPGLSSPVQNLEPERALPYVFAAISAAFLCIFQRHQRSGYLKLRTGSPGKLGFDSPPDVSELKK
jgi:hypothetical protein